MNIQCIAQGYNGFSSKSSYSSNKPLQREVVYTRDGYVKVPQAKYENDKMWSNLLVLMLGVELAFAIYRYFKK